MTSPSRSGAFDAAVDQRVEAFGESVSFDYRLYAHDIRQSIAHAAMLAAQGLISGDERDSISKTLTEIKREIDAGSFRWKTELEDVHMNIEQALIDRLGDTGRKLHTARSRNDQVTTDLRLWTRDMIDVTDQLLANLQSAFVGRCDDDVDIVMPAYTHLQRAQPVLAAHVWLCHCERFERDRQRLSDCRKRVNVCSLGTAAVAGTSLGIDRGHVAKNLGFDSVARNSLDVSSDRDFVLETAFAMTNIALHLSGWAEEWILWSTAEFGFLQLPHAFCTGSSIMPQKINPDVLELTRGKSARVVGHLQTLLTLVKGLPLAYNRDLQEDKPAFFDLCSTVQQCLELATPLVAQTTINRTAIDSRLEEGYLDATAMMEHLIKSNMPQRTAHHLVGALVRRAMELKLPLSKMPLEEFQKLDASIDESVFSVLGAKRAIACLVSDGSSGPDRVREQIEFWKTRVISASDRL